MSRDTNAALAEQDNARKDAYTGMIQSSMAKIPDDYSSQQKADITTAEMGGIDVGYGNLEDSLTRHAAATGDSAGLPETLLESNRSRIRDKAQAGAQLAETFANVPVQRALQQASIYQPALSGMLYNRYPAPSSGTEGSIIGTAGAVASTALLAF